MPFAVWRLVLLVAMLCLGRSGVAEAREFHQQFQAAYLINPDLTFTVVTTRDIEVLTDQAVAEYGQLSQTYSPDFETLTVLEAWIDQPGGARVTVPAASIFTRPSAASRDAPGFVTSDTRTIVFPQVERGSRLHLKTQQITARIPLTGFNAILTASAGGSVAISATFSAPASVKLTWGRRGGFAVTDNVQDGTRTLSVQFSEDQPGALPEPHMVSMLDIEPMFIVTTLPGYEALGALYFAQNAGKADVTPAVQQLADRIAAGRTGLAAAEAVYDWVAGNIRYLAVWLDPDAGFVAHSADAVIAAGYGDCKDHVVLMQALLSALGIRAEPALVNWDSRMTLLPHWSDAAFDHVMAYLPDFDLYANPTNAYARFDALDIGLSNKQVVIANATGEIRRTPISTPSQNRYTFASSVALAADGTLTGHTRIGMAARVDTSMRRAVADARSPEDLASRLIALTPEGGFGGMRTPDPRQIDRPFAVEGEWTSPHGVVMTGETPAFAVPVGLDFLPYTTFRQYLAADGQRRYPIIIGAAESTWTTDLTFPQGASALSVPPAIALTNAAGSYAASYASTDAGLRVRRHLIINKDVYAADEYPELQALLYAFIDDARSPLLMTKP
ncbi:DUF3857 domain-containing protein [Microvirga antarctica]|uniref:DUF3857 domain-containing protein n=1 Tax=Microvirga antarctica TaxID=2819233 RepID=UPI001B30B13E|nr:DUF3857 domain-containing protein [Microvirga antarctica]